MSSSRDDREARLVAYALGELSASERSALEAELDRDPGLEAELRRWSDTLENLTLDNTDPVAPSAGAGRELLAAVTEPTAAAAQTGTAPTVGRPPVAAPERRWVPALLAAAALLIALTAVVRQRSLDERLEHQQTARAELEAEVRLLRDRLAATEGEVDSLAQAMGASLSPGARRILLAGLESHEAASGTVLVREQAERAVFYAFDLPELATGSDYQLWLIDDAGPHSAGVFEVAENGIARLEVVRPGGFEGVATWAVTIEPEGGLDQPSGPMVLAGRQEA